MSKFLQWLQHLPKLRQHQRSEVDPRQAYDSRREHEALRLEQQLFVAAHRRFIL